MSDNNGAKVIKKESIFTRLLRNARESNTFFLYAGLIVFLLVVWVAMSIARPTTFATTDNFFNILRQISIYGILSVGMAVCYIIGGIDLSCGSVCGVCGLVLAYTLKVGVPWPVAFLSAIFFGVCAGFFNGFLISYLGMAAFVATMAMEYAWRGVCYVVTTGLPISGLPQWFTSMGSAKWLGIPMQVYFLIGMYILGAFILNNTTLGRQWYAVGGNSPAAQLSGINIRKTKLFAYAFMGFCTGVASILQTARLGSGQPTAGNGQEFEALICCALGGISGHGGSGSIIGALLGALVYGTIANAMTLLGVNGYWLMTVKGIVIVLAVLANLEIGKRARKN